MMQHYQLSLVLCILWLCASCVPLPTRERSAVQTTPDSPEVAAVRTRTAYQQALNESFTREFALGSATLEPKVLDTRWAMVATARASYTPQPTATAHFGILEHGDDVSLQSSFAPRGMIVSNAWRGTVDEEVLLVYAGKYAPHWGVAKIPLNQGNAGWLVVYHEHSYTTPEETGALTIVGECNGRLLLISAGSESLPPQRMTFDLHTYEMNPSHPADCAPTIMDTKIPSDE